MTRHILVVHPTTLRGENRGVYVQHVESLQWLLDADNGWKVDALDPLDPAFPAAALGSDIVVVHMLPHREIESMIRLRRERLLPTIFEFGDNFLGVGDWLPRNHLLRSPLVRQRLLFHAWLADAVQVYSPRLRELFARVNPRVTAFDPYVPLPSGPVRKPPGFVFGWGGTASHEADLARVAPAILTFCAAHPDAVFAYMGDLPMFRRHFAELPPGQVRIRAFGEFEPYMEFLQGLHVGIAPLSHSAFNVTRTDTKALAYAVAGAVPLLEDVAAYSGHRNHAVLFAGADELLTALERLYGDRDLLAHHAEEASAWAAAERSRERLATQRDSFYRSLLPAVACGTTPVNPNAAEAAGLAAIAALAPEDRLAAARAIAARMPTYAQAHLTVASALDSLGRHVELLDTLESFDWPAVYRDAVHEMRVRGMSATDPARAGEQIDAITSPFTRLRLRARNQEDRGAFFRAVLAEQPYDFFALNAVIREMERQDPLSPELDPLYERACLVAPESVPRERRPSSLLEFLPS